MVHKLWKTAGILIVLLLVYWSAGALTPFMHMQKVSQEFQEQFRTERFYQSGAWEHAKAFDQGERLDGNTGQPCVDRAVIVEDNQDALDLRLHMIKRAQERIVLSTFDMREDNSARDMCSALVAAADRGIEVEILIDGLYGSLHMGESPMFYALGSHDNVEIRFYNIPSLLRPWTINGRMHDKYLMVDDALYLLGGRNTFDYFLGSYEQDDCSYDREVLIYNTAAGTPSSSQSVIAQAEEYFQQIWTLDACVTVFQQPPGRLKEKTALALQDLTDHYQQMQQQAPAVFDPSYDFTTATVAVDKATLIYNPTHIMSKEPWIWYQLQSLMRGAQERVYIHTPYAVFSQDMYNDLTDIAAAVPECKMMVNSTATGDNFMASSDYTLNRNRLVKTGVSLYEFFGDYSSHGKSVVIDNDISVIGSYNFDMRSTYVDTENMLVIQSQALNQQLAQYIMAMEAQCVLVTEEGTYAPLSPEAILPEEIVQEVPPAKKAIFAVTSRLFQLIRYLL